jgi:hypothetical protein
MVNKNFRFPKEKCFGKQCYSKKVAETLKNKKWVEESVELRIYQCPICNFWHLTHSLWEPKQKRKHKIKRIWR